MKKIAYTYILAFIISILIVILFNKNLSMLINALLIVIITTMLSCDIIAKKPKKYILLDALLTIIVTYLVFFIKNTVANPFSLLPALLCMLLSISRTFKLIEK